MLSISDWVTIGCAIPPLMLSAFIYWRQCRQDRAINALDQEMRDREAQRQREQIESNAAAFISRYYADRGLIPLCAIAAMHDCTFPYRREMYREFCSCSREMQRAIIDLSDWSLNPVKHEDLYRNCLEKFRQILKVGFPADANLFYMFDQYMERTLNQYGALKVPESSFETTSRITDMLSNHTKIARGIPVLNALADELNLRTCSEVFCCWALSVEAQYIVVYAAPSSTDIYGCPGCWAGEEISHLEDQFLLTLFSIYTNCILADEPCLPPEETSHKLSRKAPL